MNFKEALIAHLQGDKVECRVKKDGRKLNFIDEFGNLSVYSVVNHDHDELYEFRLAPREILVNGVEVPAPESEAPKEGCFVYVADPASNLHHFSIKWVSFCEQYIEYLQRGLVYLNKEDAIARSKAMLITQEAV